MTDVRTSRSPLRTITLSVTAVLSALTMALAFSGTASAEPSQEELRAKIDKMGKSLSVVVEKYNDAREKLKSTKAKAAKLNKQLKPLQDKVDALYQQTGAIAAAAYKGGQASSVDAVLTSGSPTTLVDQLSTLDVLASKHGKKIDGLNVAKADLDKKKAGIDKLLSKQRSLEKDLAAKKKKIEGELRTLKVTYEKAYGPLNPPKQDYGEPPYVGGKAQSVVNFVYDQLGEPYGYGDAGPNSWDCSGLVMGAYNQVGVSLPHSARRQYNSTNRVSRGDLKPGDIVFFYSDLHHDGIYIGDGMLIHAPQPGEYVEKISLSAMPYAGAGRPSY
ncbi:MAG: NlpC/P60 family protein [Micromonosporaceae bacterium]